MEDDFLNELNEATNSLKQTTISNSNTKVNTQENKSEPKKQINNQAEEDPLKMLLGMLNVDSKDLGIDLNDPEFQAFQKEFAESMKDCGQGSGDIMNLLKMDAQDKGTSNQNTNSNPFAESFNDGGQLGDLDQIFKNLTNLSNTKDNDKPISKDDQDQIQKIIEELIEMLVSNKLLNEPMLKLKETLETQLNSNETIDPKKKENYEKMVVCITKILNELEKSKMDKKLIVDTFLELNEITDLDDKVFGGLSNEVETLFSFKNLK